MLVRGCGVDLIEIQRVHRALSRPAFKTKIYTSRELQELEGRSAQSWAARFAAKEAVMKSLGRGWSQGVPFKDVEISADCWGRPKVVLGGSALGVAQSLGVCDFALSLSHTKELAIAYVIALGEAE